MKKTKKGELEIVKEKIGGMEAMMAASPVTNDQELSSVADKIKQVKTLEKFIRQEKDKYTEPAKKIIEEAREQYDPYIKACQNAEIVLKERAKKYMIEKEDQRLKDEKGIANRVEKGTLKPETAIKKIESLPEAPKTVRTDTGSALTMSKRKVAFIENSELIPDQYWIIDEVRVRREALELDKKGLPQIPGMSIREEVDLSSR